MFGSKEDYQIFIETVLGLEKINIENQLDKAEMLGLLIEKLFNTGKVVPAAIDLIIIVEEVRTNPTESLGKYLQHKFKMDNAFVLNVSGNHCANVAVAWDLVRAFSGSLHNTILILNATSTEKSVDRIIGSYGLLSDGAGLMLLQNQSGICSLRDSVILSNGLLNKVDMNQDYSLIHLRYALGSIHKLLERNSIGPEKIKRVISQNANPLLLTNAMIEAGIDSRKIYMENLGRVGHMDSVDFIVNLKDILSANILEKDDYVLAFNMGWAGSYVSSLISIN
jgi:3-oxoacyl-[acyl-carrier-protein] synthase III